MDEKEKTRWLYRLVQVTSASVSEDLQVCLEEAERRIEYFKEVVENEGGRIDQQIANFMLENKLTYCAFDAEVVDQGREKLDVSITIGIDVKKKDRV